LKIALIGYGKMGRMFEARASARGMEVAEIYTDIRPLRIDADNPKGLEGVSVLVDFSVPEAVLGNVRSACACGIPLVEGTTGWNKHLKEAETIVQKAGIGMVHASNFSVGATLFYKIVQRAAELVSPFTEYDAFIEELHHRQKRDSPSGTALTLKQILQPYFPNTEIPVASVRAGAIPGEHRVGFDSPADSIRLEHIARSREGLADGALMAAQWIVGKKGFYDFRDVVELLIERRQG